MKLINFTIIKLTLFLVLGILFGTYLDIKLNQSLVITLVLTLVLALVFIISRRQLLTHSYFGVCALITMFSIGILTINVHDQSQWQTHYTHAKTFGLTNYNVLTLKVIAILKPTIYQNKYFVEIKTFNRHKTQGKLLLNIAKDSTKQLLAIDDVLYTKSIISLIQKPKNPHQFDYGRYLEKNQVYHQIYASNGTILAKGAKTQSIYGMAAKVRKTINLKLRTYNFNDDQLAIINALLLGHKQDVSKDLHQQYAAAGVIHILAVSGLHVGIVLWILMFLLKPLERLRKGRLVNMVIIILLLWCFTIIAGLSPSVVRAVTMFCIVAIGMHMKRPANIFNTLAISMFILLLIKPTYLFDIGFQLSYLAVFAIVWIQPILYKIWSPKNKIVDYFWRIFTVTMAAQIGVAPLSLFYFHQFPGLFFISNLVIIPLLGFILAIGILVIFSAVINALPNFLVTLFAGIIDTLNRFIGWIANQEAFLFKGISFGISSLVISYLVIILGVYTIKEPKFKRLVSVLFVILIGQGVFLFNKTKTLNAFTVFHKSRHSIIAFQSANTLQVHHNLDVLNLNTDPIIRDFTVGEHIERMDSKSLESVYKVKNELLLVVDSLSLYKVSFQPDIVLLRDSPKLNLERLIEHLNPGLIIADGSNYKSYVSRWKETCKQKKLLFHATSKKGALTINYAKNNSTIYNTY